MKAFSSISTPGRVGPGCSLAGLPDWEDVSYREARRKAEGKFTLSNGDIVPMDGLLGNFALVSIR